jgi:cold shock CspA family protein
MSGEYFYGAAGKATGGSGKPSRPEDRRGRPAVGRIVRLLVGQSHGTIRLADGRDVFFHRADVQDGTAFNDLQVGDSVRFELFEDRVSGARALRVIRNSKSR